MSSRSLRRAVALVLRVCRELWAAEEEEVGRDMGRCPVKGLHFIP